MNQFQKPRMMVRSNIRSGNSSSILFIVLICLCYCGVGMATKPDDKNIVIKSCRRRSSCSCVAPDLGLVDLTPLARSDGEPMFRNVESGIQQFSWNPCFPFTQDQCVDVAMCQRLTFPSSGSYTLGSQDSAAFIVNNKGFQLTYTSNTLDHTNVNATFLRISYIKLVCDLTQNPGVFKAEGEDQDFPGHYYFTLTSLHACPSRLKPFPAAGGLSPGSCLLIIAVVMVFVYLIVGIALQIFAFKRSGSDIIPNKELWVALPGLVKEGCLFVTGKRKSQGYVEM